MKAKYKTGLQRFYDRYPNYPIEEREEDYIGVGAICDEGLIERLMEMFHKRARLGINRENLCLGPTSLNS